MDVPQPKGRRQGDDVLSQLLAIVTELNGTVTSASHQIKELDNKLVEHMNNEEREKLEHGKALAVQASQLAAQSRSLNKLVDDVEALAAVIQAFPHEEGIPDFFGHRSDHETRKKAGEDSAEMRKTAKKVVVEWVVKGILTLLALGYFTMHQNEASIREKQMAERLDAAQKQSAEMAEVLKAAKEDK